MELLSELQLSVTKQTAKVSKPQRFVAKMMFTACLNWADFASDWMVVLQYGCIIGTSLPQGNSCTADTASGCQAHPWWFSIGLSLLIISTLLQSFCWTVGVHHYLRDHGLWPHGLIRKLLVLTAQFVLGCCQLHYLVDIAMALKFQETPEDQDSLALAIFWRELMVKVIETVPQLYFQIYVLVALEAHENAWRLISLMISLVALGHGLVQVLRMLPSQEVNRVFNESLLYRLLAMVYLSSDQAMRAICWALLLSPPLRFLGLGLMILALLFCLVMDLTVFRPSSRGETFMKFLAVVFLCYLVPLAGFWSQAVFDRRLIKFILPLRYLEVALAAALTMGLTRNSCNEQRTREVVVLCSLMCLNILICISLLCLDPEPVRSKEKLEAEQSGDECWAEKSEAVVPHAAPAEDGDLSVASVEDEHPLGVQGQS